MTLLHGKMTFDGLAKRALFDASRDARKLRAEDADIEPKVYLYAPSSETLHIHAVGQGFTGPEARNAFIRATVALIKVGGVNLVAVRWTGYGAYMPTDLTRAERAQIERNEVPDRIVPPSERPDSEREEFAMVTVFDPEVVDGWRSTITRRPGQPPKFGPWRSNLDVHGGAMIDPILEALR